MKTPTKDILTIWEEVKDKKARWGCMNCHKINKRIWDLHINGLELWVCTRCVNILQNRSRIITNREATQ